MTTFLYNPDRKSKEYLITEFVVRTGIYEAVMQDLESSTMNYAEQHYLFIGQRGAGKTTLLNRIKYGIEDSEKLGKLVIPLQLSEEQYHITELANLWERIALQLNEDHGFEGIVEEMEIQSNREDFEERCFDLLEKHLKKNKKKLVLLIDNLVNLVNKLEKTEVHRLREILQTKPEIRLIAGSSFYPDNIADYHQPLFEFFKVIFLDGLTEAETQTLLLKLAEINNETASIQKIIKETPQRIETLRALTGGVPRTIALMFRIFVEYNNEDTVKDLEKILDAVTPLYKHRMDDLPTQQQKIVDAVAMNWDGITVKALKDKLRMEGKAISSQLKQLEKNQVIEIVSTNTKNHLYFIRERFFNIWYLMRYGRKTDKQRVIWLVRFLESWCTTNEIEHRIHDYVARLKDGKLNQQMADFYGELYAAVNNISAHAKLVLKKNSAASLSKQIRISNAAILKEARTFVEQNNHAVAFELLKELAKPTHEELVTLLSFWNPLLMDVDIISKLSSSNNRQEAAENISIFELLMLLYDSSVAAILKFRNSEFEKGHEIFLAAFKLEESFTEIFGDSATDFIDAVLFILLTMNQPHFVLSLFEAFPFWKDRLKPTYYATLKLAGQESEFQKSGKELQDAIEKIILRVEDERKTEEQ